MTRMISIHSSRGGTGKSLIASSLATILAFRGLNVALLDFDFRAPSLSTIFQAEKRSKRFVNDYLDGNAKLEDVMVDMSEAIHRTGTLGIGFADFEVDAMRQIAREDKEWQAKLLKRVPSLKEDLVRIMNVDIILIDTSPGIQYSSLNAIVSSDLVIIISTMDLLDLDGCQRLQKDLYELFQKKALIIINKAYPPAMLDEVCKNALIAEVNKRFSQPPLAIIPCFCDILLEQGASIFVQKRQKHPFTKTLNDIALRIEKIK